MTPITDNCNPHATRRQHRRRRLLKREWRVNQETTSANGTLCSTDQNRIKYISTCFAYLILDWSTCIAFYSKVITNRDMAMKAKPIKFIATSFSFAASIAIKVRPIFPSDISSSVDEMTIWRTALAHLYLPLFLAEI